MDTKASHASDGNGLGPGQCLVIPGGELEELTRAGGCFEQREWVLTASKVLSGTPHS